MVAGCAIFLGGYIRLYPPWISLRTSALVYVGMCLLTFLSKKPMHYLFQSWGIPAGHFSGFYNYNSPTIIAAALALFMFCLRLPDFSGWIGRLIRYVGPLSFGVYLIHENPFVRRELWGHWIHTQSMYHSPWLLVHFFATVLGIFIVCIIIDALRAKAAEAVIRVWRMMRERS